MRLRKRFDRTIGIETILNVEGKTYELHDTYMIGEIAVRDAVMYDFLYQTVDDKFIWQTLVADDDQTFGQVQRGFTVLRYVPKEFAMALREAWALIREQPDISRMENYFREIRLHSKFNPTEDGRP